jgi:hypothetical protein
LWNKFWQEGGRVGLRLADAGAWSGAGPRGGARGRGGTESWGGGGARGESALELGAAPDVGSGLRPREGWGGARGKVGHRGGAGGRGRGGSRWERGAASVRRGESGGADWDRGGCVRGLRGVLGGKGARTAGERQPARLVSEVRGEPARCFEGLEARASGLGENDGARRRGR